MQRNVYVVRALDWGADGITPRIVWDRDFLTAGSACQHARHVCGYGQGYDEVLVGIRAEYGPDDLPPMLSYWFPADGNGEWDDASRPEDVPIHAAADLYDACRVWLGGSAVLDWSTPREDY